MEANKATITTRHRAAAPPSQEFVAGDESGAATAPAPKPKDAPITDALGRKLKLRELTLLNEIDLLAAMPPAHSAQPMILGRAMLAARVEAVDDELLPIPLSPVQYRSMMARVGRDGIVAVIGATLPTDDEAEQDQSADTAKN